MAALRSLLLLLPLLLAPPAARAQFVRPYYGGGPLLLNTTTLQYDVDASVQIAADFDLATIDADSWGVPWDAFIYEQPLPRSWELKLNATVEAWRGWDRALLLLLPMGDNDSRRSCPSQNATDSPTGLPVLSPVGGCARCFDYNTTTSPVAAFFRQGYVNYVLAMAAAFSLNAPSKNAPLVGVAFALDANRVLEAGCGEEWLRAYVDFSNQVYASVKQFLPELPVFPAFQLESFYGLRAGQACSAYSGADMAASKPAPALLACFDANYEALAGMQRDVFAFTASPSALSGGNWRVPREGGREGGGRRGKEGGSDRAAEGGREGGGREGGREGEGGGREGGRERSRCLAPPGLLAASSPPRLPADRHPLCAPPRTPAAGRPGTFRRRSTGSRAPWTLRTAGSRARA